VRYYLSIMNVRLLAAGDEPILEAFLVKHRDTSMFLRSNIRRCGLNFRPEPFHATYVGAVRDGRVNGVVAHAWNGMILVQAPENTEELALECEKRSGRRVTGLTGPLEQVKRTRVALGLTSSPATIESDEWLYGLDFCELVIPSLLLDAIVTYRPPLDNERDMLREWRFDYDIEALGSPASDETRRRSTDYLDMQLAARNVWVAVENDRPVSQCGFNAVLPDIVQLGPIYTPPALRGRGYAKVAVAGSLIAARERGVSRAVLFTDNPSAAQSYEAVGFRREGDYGLVLFK
jgi:RimJ/RimL family protein N-acetyltransferase